MIKKINNLSISKKFLLLITSVIIFFIVFTILVHRFILYQNYINLEHHWARKDARRARQSIEREIFHLENTCNDWSSWDDTCRFVRTGNQSFINSNLNYESFVSGNFNLVSIIDNNYNIKFIKGVDLGSGEKKLPVFFSNMQRIRKSGILDFPKDIPLKKQTNAGLILTEYGIMMLSVRPILTSETTGQSEGYFIIGRYLDDHVVSILNIQTEVIFSIVDITSKSASRISTSDFEKLISSGEEFHIKNEQKNILTTSLYPDISGNPAFLIKVISHRNITEQGMEVLTVSLLTLFIGLIVIMALIWIMLRSSVINPINVLKKQVKAIAMGEGHINWVLERQDELGLLSHVIDDMAKTITIQTDKLKDANSRLEIMSITDSLTGTFNRRYLDERIRIEWTRACRSGETLSLIMCDIDFFKNYNDIYGHQIGDNCLKKVAASIKNSIHRMSDAVYRYGGEEFLILLPGTPVAGAIHEGRTILNAVSQLGIEHTGSDIFGHITISAGIASMIPKHNSSVNDLITYADQALYKSKERGRNMLCVAEFSEDGGISFPGYSI